MFSVHLKKREVLRQKKKGSIIYQKKRGSINVPKKREAFYHKNGGILWLVFCISKVKLLTSVKKKSNLENKV
jgi:hypothetical protein